MATRDPTVEEYAIRFVRKYLKGDFARAVARTNDDDGAAVGADDANRAAAADTLVDLLRKCSDDPVLLKVPLRVLRDEILRRYDEHRHRRDRDRAPSLDESALPADVESLFALFDGVHRVCVTLASRLTAGPYEQIDRALRLRLFLCVCGETWRDAPALRACALRRCHAFAREEDAHEASRATTTKAAAAGGANGFSSHSATAVSSSRRSSASASSSSSSSSSGWLGSIASRAVPAFVSHDAVDVSSWRRVIGQIYARCPARLMSPAVECLLESLRVRGPDCAAANVVGPIASRQLGLDDADATTEYVLYGETTVVRADANPPKTPPAPDLLGFEPQLCAPGFDGFDGFDVTTPIDDDRANLTAGWETFETPPTTLTPPTPTLTTVTTTVTTTDGRSSRAISTGASTGEKGLVFDGSFGSDASLTSAFRPDRAGDIARADHGTSHGPIASRRVEPHSCASFGAFGSFPVETPPGKEPSQSSSSAADGSGKSSGESSGKLGALASVAARLPVRDSHDFDELVRDLERM